MEPEDRQSQWKNCWRYQNYKPHSGPYLKYLSLDASSSSYLQGHPGVCSAWHRPINTHFYLRKTNVPNLLRSLRSESFYLHHYYRRRTASELILLYIPVSCLFSFWSIFLMAIPFSMVILMIIFYLF